jgi:PAS domain-containing protein
MDLWPQSLRTTISIMLRSPIPMVLLWGPDGIMIYNDAYTIFAGGRHPRLLGSKVLEGWAEVADFNANVMRVGMAGGTLSYRDQELTLYRNGVPEQVWMNLDYSPVIDETGKPGGVLAIVVETTERVMAERRLAAEKDRLRELFHQAPGFMVIYSGPDHVFELVNEAYYQLVGRREIIGKPLLEALPEVADRASTGCSTRSTKRRSPSSAAVCPSICSGIRQGGRNSASSISSFSRSAMHMAGLPASSPKAVTSPSGCARRTISGSCSTS